MGVARALNLRLAPTTALRSPLEVDLEIIGAWLSATKPQVGFVQVGAFDGRTNDPIHDLVRRHGWRGVLVEPQPEPFARLRETYAGVDGLVLVNAAVAEQRGSMTLWRVGDPQPDDPWWVARAASFSREHLAKIVAMLDQIDVAPTVVRFEHRNLSRADHASTIDRLAARSYRFVIGDDTLAVQHAAGRGSTATR
jgi:hypothetical protein